MQVTTCDVQITSAFILNKEQIPLFSFCKFVTPLWFFDIQFSFCWDFPYYKAPTIKYHKPIKLVKIIKYSPCLIYKTFHRERFYTYQ